MADLIQIRRDVRSNWDAANPTLAIGEVGLITDNTGEFTGSVSVKVGNGSNHWSELPEQSFVRPGAIPDLSSSMASAVYGLKQTVNQLSGSLNTRIIQGNENTAYLVCETPAGTAAKTVTDPNFVLTPNARVIVSMTYGNSVNGVTLKIGNSEARALYYDGAQASTSNSWAAGEVLDIYYDGSYYWANNVAGGGTFASGQKVKEVSIDAEPVSGSVGIPTSGGTYKLIEETVSGSEERAADIYAQKTGYYSTMGVGVAANLVGRGSVPAEYTFRTSGGDADIGTGIATIKSIEGNTLVWNQLVQNGDFSNGTTGWSITRATASVANNCIELTLDEGEESMSIGINAPFKQNHKILLSYKYKGNARIIQRFYVKQAATDSIINLNYQNLANTSSIITLGNEGTSSLTALYFIFTNIESESVTVGNIKAFDLTAMFGAGNEPSTVAEFEALYPLNYYNYSAPKFINNAASGIKTVGFNQWDEQWETGNIDVTTGENLDTFTTTFRSKNRISVFPGVNYYFNFPARTITYYRLFYYDANGSFISTTSYQSIPQIITIPSNCYFFRFVVSKSIYGSETYNNDICINLSWSGYRNGEYEPYEEHTLYFDAENGASGSLATITGVPSGSSTSEIIFPDGPKSVGNVRDEYNTPVEGYLTKADKRVGVDSNLGSHEYVKQGNLYTTSEVVPENANLDVPQGKAVVWNQLNKDSVRNTILTAEAGDTLVGVSNTTLGDNTQYYASHKYFFKAKVTTLAEDADCLFFGGVLKSVGLVTDSEIKYILSPNADANRNSSFTVRARLAGTTTEGGECGYKDLVCIDLTQMFGAGNEPSTVEEFEALMGGENMLDYYAYDTGHLGIINNDTYATAAAFKTAMDGVKLHYQLNTPINYTLDNPIPANYYVNDFGTEKRLPQDTASSVIAPILYHVQYAMNAVDTIRRLPINYIKKSSFDNFTSELSTKLGAFLSASIAVSSSYDTLNQEYTYSINIAAL